MAISRRDMIRTGALGGAALLVGIALSRVTRAATLDAVRTETLTTATTGGVLQTLGSVAHGKRSGGGLDGLAMSRRVAPFTI
jgi:hypothetical protein